MADNKDQESNVDRLDLGENEESDDKGEQDVENDDDKEETDRKDTEKPLLEKETVKIDIFPNNESEDTPTLPLPDKKSKAIDNSEEEKKQRDKLPKYLFPFTRLKNAWDDSTNVFQFLGRATFIIFHTVGWFTCVGGVPFLSLVMLIIGSIYVHECKIEPNIPVYLIVSGVIGTIQHFLSLWIRYVPKDSVGKLRTYRTYCNALNGLFHLFLIVWFILGCIWVYRNFSEVEFEDPEKDEYCHKTLYNFSFWILNLSFILLGLLLIISMWFLIFLNK